MSLYGHPYRIQCISLMWHIDRSRAVELLTWTVSSETDHRPSIYADMPLSPRRAGDGPHRLPALFYRRPLLPTAFLLFRPEVPLCSSSSPSMPRSLLSSTMTRCTRTRLPLCTATFGAFPSSMTRRCPSSQCGYSPHPPHGAR